MLRDILIFSSGATYLKLQTGKSKTLKEHSTGLVTSRMSASYTTEPKFKTDWAIHWFYIFRCTGVLLKGNLSCTNWMFNSRKWVINLGGGLPGKNFASSSLHAVLNI